MMTKCTKCRGAGFLASLRHIDDGVCYTCNGLGECEQTEGKSSKGTARPLTETQRAEIKASLRRMYAALRDGVLRLDAEIAEDLNERLSVFPELRAHFAAWL
jgi:hypothetical protein